VTVSFKLDSPFKEKKLKSGKGNYFFGDRARKDAEKGKQFKYAIEVDGKEVADPVIQIR
jgi:hypothetical protein